MTMISVAAEKQPFTNRWGALMGDLLEQSEIDALLAEATDVDEPEQPSPSAGHGGGKSKLVWRRPKRVIPRSYNPYRSPVVKANNVVMNPASGSAVAPGQVAVQTVDSYWKNQKARIAEHDSAITVTQYKAKNA